MKRSYMIWCMILLFIFSFVGKTAAEEAGLNAEKATMWGFTDPPEDVSLQTTEEIIPNIEKNDATEDQIALFWALAVNQLCKDFELTTAQEIIEYLSQRQEENEYNDEYTFSYRAVQGREDENRVIIMFSDHIGMILIIPSAETNYMSVPVTDIRLLVVTPYVDTLGNLEISMKDNETIMVWD